MTKKFNQQELEFLTESTTLSLHNLSNTFKLMYDEDSPESYKKILYGITLMLDDKNFCQNMIDVAERSQTYSEEIISPVRH